MADTRIYAVTRTVNISTKDEREEVIALIEAANKSQALAYHARQSFGVGVATPGQLIAATKNSIEVEQAGAEE